MKQVHRSKIRRPPSRRQQAVRHQLIGFPPTYNPPPTGPKPKQDETESSAVSLLEKAEACYHTTSERIQVSGAFGTLGFPYCVHVFRTWISKHFKKY